MHVPYVYIKVRTALVYSISPLLAIKRNRTKTVGELFILKMYKR